MFYDEDRAAFRILGVFRVARGAGTGDHRGRKFATLAYRVRGNSRFTCEGKEWSAGSGSIVFLPSETPFRRVSEGAEEIFVIHLECAGAPPREIGVETGTEEFAPLFERMLAAWEEGAPGARNRCMALMYTLFEKLQTRSSSDRAAIPPVIAPGVALMRRRFRDPAFRLVEAARASFVSEAYFRRVYRKAFGLSPEQGLLDLRFSHAAALLRSGYYSTDQAARLSGFSDAKYFRTAFSRRFGKSPAALRREREEE